MQSSKVPVGDNSPAELFDNSEQLMTYDQVAELFHVSLRTAKRWRAEGRIRPVKQHGRTIRFLRAQILREAPKIKGA